MKIENIDTSALIPYINNNKIHNDRQIKLIASSIKEFGFKQPIVVGEDGVVIAGHGRLAAADLLGLKEVPCVIADDLTPAQIKAYRIADNKLSELAEWDEEAIAAEMQELEELDFNLDMTGFSEKEIEELNTKFSDTEIIEDECPEVDEENEPYSKLGDVWLLGRHRLMCGDSTKEDVATILMNNQKADMLLTDPPYSEDIVLDLFGGSGTIIITCEQNGRTGYSMELDPKYVDVIVKRYHNLESKTDIKLIRDGKEYDWEEIKRQLVGE